MPKLSLTFHFHFITDLENESSKSDEEYALEDESEIENSLGEEHRESKEMKDPLLFGRRRRRRRRRFLIGGTRRRRVLGIRVG